MEGESRDYIGKVKVKQNKKVRKVERIIVRNESEKIKKVVKEIRIINFRGKVKRNRVGKLKEKVERESGEIS